MYSCLLKKLLPFALTFIVGATIGGLFKSSVTTRTLTERNMLMFDHRGYGYGHSCRMHSRDLVAETKPLVILFKPDAVWPRGVEMMKNDPNSALVRVTFGADGKVHEVEPSSNSPVEIEHLTPPAVWNAIERAARQIQFTPEIVNGIPITVTKDVEIHFMRD